MTDIICCNNQIIDCFDFSSHKMRSHIVEFIRFQIVTLLDFFLYIIASMLPILIGKLLLINKILVRAYKIEISR